MKGPREQELRRLINKLRRNALKELTATQRELRSRCDLRLWRTNETKEYYIAGTIGGNQVRIYRDHGTIAGGEIEKYTAQRLFDKYRPIAEYQGADFRNLAQALLRSHTAQKIAEAL